MNSSGMSESKDGILVTSRGLVSEGNCTGAELSNSGVLGTSVAVDVVLSGDSIDATDMSPLRVVCGDIDIAAIDQSVRDHIGRFGLQLTH